MPLLNIQCTKEIDADLVKELSSAVAETIGKPEQYVMVCARTAEIMMSGESGDAAYAEVKSLGGLDRVVNHELSMKISVLLNDHLGIAQDRIYITFQSLERDHWGWNGSVFG